jgi:hypothetical protein
MNVRRASALLVAVVATGIGLTACGGGSSPSASPGASAAGSPTPGTTAVATATAGSPQSTTTADSTAAAQPKAPASSAPAPSKAPASVPAGQGASGSFTVQPIAGENVAEGSGTYTKGTGDVEVHVCVTQTGKAFAVGIQAVVYNSAGATKDIGAVVLTGAGQQSCGTLTFIGYTAHLKVHTFIGAGGNITKTSPVLSVY